MTIQIFLIRLNQWKPGKEATATKKVEEIAGGEEANILDCEFERDINIKEVNDLATVLFIAKSISVDGSYVFIDPEGLENFSKELMCRVALDQKSRVLGLEKIVL